jgi:hypothetical protein
MFAILPSQMFHNELADLTQEIGDDSSQVKRRERLEKALPTLISGCCKMEVEPGDKITHIHNTGDRIQRLGPLHPSLVSLEGRKGQLRTKCEQAIPHASKGGGSKLVDSKFSILVAHDDDL